MKSRYIVALVQMDTQDDKEKNIQNMIEAIAEAKQRGASLVVFPEFCFYQGKHANDQAETIPGPSINRIMKSAQDNAIYVIAGSCKEKTEGNPYNTSVLISDKGRIICKYRKNHMFDVEMKELEIRESSVNRSGNEIAAAKTELGCIGINICYDLRFPEVFRLEAMNGAQLFVIPSCFYTAAGKDHWAVLLRARAIENGCYILACNQIGNKPKSGMTYGRSMVVDPWGNIIAMASDRPGIIYADIDLDLVRDIRNQIPGLKNRRDDLYSLTSNCVQIYEE